MIVRCAYDHDVVIHFNNKKGMIKKVKECESLKDSDSHGRIDIVKHKIIEHKVVER